MMQHKKLKISLVVVLILCIACWIYVADDYPANDAAIAAMSPVSGISVIQGKNTVAFVPQEYDAGFIFYPGGKVEHTAYAPLMRALAQEGILCVLTEMPLNLAVLDMNAAGDIPEQYPEIENWYIGGHSLGGSMAASHAEKNADQYDGLVLLAAYSTADLSSSNIPVISVYGSEDGVLNMEKYEEYKDNLPSGFEEHIIEGGCHAGFGGYGPQDGDGVPTLSSENQIRETVRLLAGFFT